jgi:hypothetical protein
MKTLDERNIEAYFNGEENLVCIKCEETYTLDDTFSNQGSNCICRACLRRELDRTGMSEMEYLKAFIWR